MKSLPGEASEHTEQPCGSCLPAEVCWRAFPPSLTNVSLVLEEIFPLGTPLTPAECKLDLFYRIKSQFSAYFKLIMRSEAIMPG